MTSLGPIGRAAPGQGIPEKWRARPAGGAMFHTAGEEDWPFGPQLPLP